MSTKAMMKLIRDVKASLQAQHVLKLMSIYCSPQELQAQAEASHSMVADHHHKHHFILLDHDDIYSMALEDAKLEQQDHKLLIFQDNLDHMQNQFGQLIRALQANLHIPMLHCSHQNDNDCHQATRSQSPVSNDDSHGCTQHHHTDTYNKPFPAEQYMMTTSTLHGGVMQGIKELICNESEAIKTRSAA